VLVTEPMPRVVRHKVYAADYVDNVASSGAELETSAVVKGTRGGTVLIGASRERVGFDTSMSVEVVRRLAAQAVRLSPFLADIALMRLYWGFRPYCPEHLPVIGADPRIAGVFHAGGHEGAGIGLAPATGRLVAQLLTGEATTVDPTPYSPVRFIPAGLSAATTAGRTATVALLDAGAFPGGQYWRQPATASLGAAPPSGLDPSRLAYLHHGLGNYRQLVDRLRAQVDSGVTMWLAQHHVWTVERADDGYVVHAVERSGAVERAVRVTGGRRLVLATGAYDRQVPFPGWTLPGVITAGGAQALLKGSGVVAGSRIVVAGTGPFLLPVAAGLADSGATVLGVHEAGSPRAWLSHVGPVLRNVGKLGEAVGYARALVRHRVPVRTRSIVLTAEGEDHLKAVTVAKVRHNGVIPGTERRLACDTLAVGWGFTPQLELALELGCETKVDKDGSVVCQVDDNQRTSVPEVFTAGETCGVGGAVLALVEGAIAGAAAASAADGPTDDTARLKRQRSALRSFAAAMHASHPVPAG